MNKLWKFSWDCGRMGQLDGLFVATQEEVDKVIGKEIYFGEVLGKHSDIMGNLEIEDLTEIKIDEEAINEIVAAVGDKTISGYNPLDYYYENRYEDDDEE